MAWVKRALVTGAAVVLLSGCAAGGTASVDPPETSVVGIPLACADLVAHVTLADALGADATEVPLTFDGSGDYYVLSQLGLAQAGALRCEWSDGAAAGPERYLQLSVLPGASDDWAIHVAEVAAFQPVQDAVGDASHHQCTTTDGRTSCRVDVLAGDRWLNAVFGRVATEDAALALVADALDVLAGTPDGDLPVVEAALACDALAGDAAVADALGGTVALTDNPGPVQPVIYHAGFLAAGGTHCYWRGSFDATHALAAHAGILPGGAAVWDDYWAGEPNARVDRETVADLGDAAYAGCSGQRSCFAAALTGDTWVTVSVTSEAEPDSRHRAVELVRVLLAGV